MDEEEKLKKALLRKALGYSVKEETIEYARDSEGEEVVSKRKVSKKYIPPDTTALRLLMEHFYGEEYKDVEDMSDEELLQERAKIIELLKEEEKNAIKKDEQDNEV